MRQVRLPAEVNEQLNALARVDNRSPSDVIREALADYIASHTASPAKDASGSAASASGHVSVLEGGKTVAQQDAGATGFRFVLAPGKYVVQVSGDGPLCSKPTVEIRAGVQVSGDGPLCSKPTVEIRAGETQTTAVTCQVK